MQEALEYYLTYLFILVRSRRSKCLEFPKNSEKQTGNDLQERGHDLM